MNYIVLIAGCLIALFAASAFIAIWSRRDTYGRACGVILFIVGIPAVAAASVETLGWAKPVSLMWELDRDREYLVRAAKMVQDVGIWIYLDTGEMEPRSVRFPWSNSLADAMQEAVDGAPNGREGEFLIRLDPSLDDNEPQVHAIPQPPALPPKQEPEPGMTYTQPEE